jgi:hypothetical protein
MMVSMETFRTRQLYTIGTLKVLIIDVFFGGKGLMSVDILDPNENEAF